MTAARRRSRRDAAAAGAAPAPARRAGAGRRAARDRPRARLRELGAAARVRRARRRPRPRPAARLPRRPRLPPRARVRPAGLRHDASPGAVAAFATLGRAADRGGRPRRSSRASTASRPGRRSRRHVRSLRASGEPFAQAFDAVEARDPKRAGRAARPLARAGRAARHERQRPAGHGRRDGRQPARRSCCSSAAPTRRAATRTAGRRCTRPRTAAGVELAELLLAAGAPADVSARGDGGTPLVIALFWGHPVPPALVDRIGLAPGNLRVAAGPRADRHDRRAGRGRTAACTRPPERTAASTGRTAASRSGSRPTIPQEVLDEALSWAARSQPRRGGRAAGRPRRERSRPTSTAARR